MAKCIGIIPFCKLKHFVAKTMILLRLSIISGGRHHILGTCSILKVDTYHVIPPELEKLKGLYGLH